METLFDIGPWNIISDGDYSAFKLFQRHYSFNNISKRNGSNKLRICAPGERLMLMTTNRNALFIWSRQQYRKDSQTGINCAVFRNESNILSSILITEAVKLAKLKWNENRFFTFVNSSKIKSTNPGYCFKKAGWKECGETATRKLLILEYICQ